MSRPSCPTCNKPIDPTHAPVARIRGAKIVTFCSASCAEGKPPAAVSAPPKESEPPPKPAPAAKAAPATIRKRKASISESWLEPAALVEEPNVDEPPKAKATPETAKAAEAAKAKPPAPVTRPAKESEPPTPAAAAASDAIEPSLKITGGGGKKMLIFGCAALICGGAALAVIDVVSASSDSDAESTSSEPAADQTALPQTSVPKAKSAKAKSDSAQKSSGKAVPPEVVYDRAVATLTELRTSPSRRIERLSTMALARTGDAKALAGLRKLLDTEESSLNKIALGYALARAGDEKGREVLRAGLTHDRRDVRSDASIALLNLGDDAGRDPLKRMTNLRHYKISACGHLARAGDAKAKVILEKVYRDPNEDPETVLRAGVALGRAGDKSVAEYLRTTLADGRFQVGAADALAALGDKAAIEPLTNQLELNAMRVRAALALRRLDADVSLAPLAVALTEDDEVTRVTAAEAILILAGPKELAARD